MARLSGQITFSNSLPLIYHDTCIKLAAFILFMHDNLSEHIEAKLKWDDPLFTPQQGKTDET